jgi:hypothetical protein
MRRDLRRFWRRADDLEVASLITESWKPLLEWLKRVETLRDCLQVGPECCAKA